MINSIREKMAVVDNNAASSFCSLTQLHRLKKPYSLTTVCILYTFWVRKSTIWNFKVGKWSVTKFN